MNQEAKEDFIQGAVIGVILGACALLAFFATKEESQHVQLEVIEERVISDQQRLDDLRIEHERIESAIRKERERRKVEADIQSMYLPSYLAGC